MSVKIDTIEIETSIIAPVATTGVDGLMSATDKTKVDSVASGATANSSDATLLNRANHTGTQIASTISDFSEAVDDRVAALLTAGTNITLTYDDTANTLTIDSTGGGGYTNEDAQDAVGGILTDSSSIDFTYNDVTNTITADVIAGSITNAMLAGSIDATKIDSGLVTNTEFNYLDGVTSSIQTQLNGKANLVGGNTFANTQTMSPTATISGLNVGSTASNPSSLNNGDVWYNSTTNTFNIRNNGSTVSIRNLVNIQVLTSGTTYTPTSGTNYVRIKIVGGGGGGGGVTSSASSSAVAGGGASGSYCEAYVPLTGAASYTCAIGAGGTGGSNAGGIGGAGGSSSLTIGATTYTAPGGNGGNFVAVGTTAAIPVGGTVGAIATNGNIMNITGQGGSRGHRLSATLAVGGQGGDSLLGIGGSEVTLNANNLSASNNGIGYGSGGSGAATTGNGGGARTGGVGAQGVIIIEEYS